MSRILTVKLTPKAASSRIGDLRVLEDGGEQLSVYVTAPPDKGKANAALIRLLAEHLGIAPSRIEIIRGETSRIKRLQID